MRSRDQPYSHRILEMPFCIVSCFKIIENLWEGVTKRILTSAWKKLWPESVSECDIKEYETVFLESTVNEIVSLAKIICLEADSKDIDEIMVEVKTEELMELHCLSEKEKVTTKQ
ncbi:hypothetical protein AVEN_130566-1 [Araneus ventricosus]|uniref:DDE-1 domain-containing protein n=1 Tax=Araneus ventricosus TaxID=182803 RepID=A0A4Y2MLD5_ARAVE|nr:hypothetical protein AVEN_130566-1 [Araneus ventricosus]